MILRFRPHHVLPESGNRHDQGGWNRQGGRTVRFGEPSFTFDMLGKPWVSLTPGIHPFDAGDTASLNMDVSRGFYFGRDGRLIGG